MVSKYGDRPKTRSFCYGKWRDRVYLRAEHADLFCGEFIDILTLVKQWQAKYILALPIFINTEPLNTLVFLLDTSAHSSAQMFNSPYSGLVCFKKWFSIEENIENRWKQMHNIRVFIFGCSRDFCVFIFKDFCSRTQKTFKGEIIINCNSDLILLKKRDNGIRPRLKYGLVY